MRAEEIARQYARNELEVAEAQLSRMKVVATGWYEDERKVLEFEFYNPEYFPDWENMSGMLGGFPEYFTIEIDISNWDVLDYYASPM